MDTPNNGQTPQKRTKRRQSINMVQLLGNVGGDPTITLKGDRVIASFSLAVDKSYNDSQTGELIERVNWIDIVAYGRTAETVRDYVKRGMQLQIVQGRLDYNEYLNADQQKRSSLQVIADRILFMGSSRRDNSTEDSSGNYESDPRADLENHIPDDIPM